MVHVIGFWAPWTLHHTYIEHCKGLFFSCTSKMCSFNCCFWAKLALEWIHLSGVFLPCIEVMRSFNIDLFEKALLHTYWTFFPITYKVPLSLCTSYLCFFKPSFCVKFALQFEHFFLSIASRNSISSFNMALMNRCNMQFHSFTLIKVLITNCTPEWLLPIMRCWNVSF